MRDRLRLEEILYTVIICLISALTAAAVIVAFFVPALRESLLRAVFFLGVLLNTLVAVHRYSDGRGRSFFIFGILAVICLYYALRW